jgi:hypothetical protein
MTTTTDSRGESVGEQDPGQALGSFVLPGTATAFWHSGTETLRDIFSDDASPSTPDTVIFTALDVARDRTARTPGRRIALEQWRNRSAQSIDAVELADGDAFEIVVAVG